MTKYFIYRFKATNEIKVYLAETDDDAGRVANILKDPDSGYENIHTFQDTEMIYTNLTIGLNRMLNALNAPVIFTRDKISTDDILCLNVKLANGMFVDSCILNMSNEFWAIIEDVLTTFKFKFSYNNTRSCIFIQKGE